MKFLFLAISLCIGVTAMGQTQADSIYLEIIAHKDTVAQEQDGRVFYTLTNKSAFPLVLSNRAHIYWRRVKLDGNPTDTASCRWFMEKADIQHITSEAWTILPPGQSLPLQRSLFDGCFLRAGRYKAQLVYRLDKLNRNCTAAVSPWITVNILPIKYVIER